MSHLHVPIQTDGICTTITTVFTDIYDTAGQMY